MRQHLTKNEKITLALSILALFVSLFSFYFQFFYISERITVAKVDCQMPLQGLQGTFGIKICLINNGLKEAVVFDCMPIISDVFIELTKKPEIPLILKPSQIIIIEYAGNLDVTKNENGANKSSDEFFVRDGDIKLSYRVVGAKGYDRSGVKTIGKLIVNESQALGMEIVGFDFLKIPIDLE